MRPCPELTVAPLTYGTVSIPTCLSGNYGTAFPPLTQTLVGAGVPAPSSGAGPATPGLKNVPLQNSFNSYAHTPQVSPAMDVLAYHEDWIGKDGVAQAFGYQPTETGGSGPGYTLAYPPITDSRINSDSCGRVVLDMTNVSGSFQHLSGPRLTYRFPFFLNTYNTGVWGSGPYFFDPEMTYLVGQPYTCGLLAPSAPALEILSTNDDASDNPSQLYTLSITWGMRLQLLACSYVDPIDLTYPGGPGLNGSDVKPYIIGAALRGWSASGPAYWHYTGSPPYFEPTTWPTSCGDGSGPYSTYYGGVNYGDDVTYNISDFASGDHTITFSRVFDAVPIGNVSGVAGTYARSSVVWEIEIQLFMQTFKNFAGYPYTAGTLPFVDYGKVFQYALAADNVSFSYVLTPYAV
jgi:hypothetical protein